MGAVYEALDVSSDARVAVKVIRSERIGASERSHAIKRFERESRAIGALATPNIVRLLEAGHDDKLGIPFLVMELLQGRDLKQLLEEHGPLPASLVIRLVAHAARGLVAAHAIGLVHRDIKPANIFVCETEGEEELCTKVLDFGVSKFQPGGPNSENTSVSIDGGMIGSPAYMSPEQARGESDIDARTDIWSLGVVMYEALSGRLPFGEKLPLGQVILAICAQPARPIREVAPWVPEAVAVVVHRAIAKSREERFASAEALLEALIGLEDDRELRIERAMIQGISEAEVLSSRATAASTSGSQPAAGGTDSGGEARHTATDIPRSRGADFESIRPVSAESVDLPMHVPFWTRSRRIVATLAIAASALGVFFERARFSEVSEAAIPEAPLVFVPAAVGAGKIESALSLELPIPNAPPTATAAKRAANSGVATARPPGARTAEGPKAKPDDVYAP